MRNKLLLALVIPIILLFGMAEWDETPRRHWFYTVGLLLFLLLLGFWLVFKRK